MNTNAKVKLPGDAVWTGCTTANVCGGVLFFETARRLNIGDIVSLQFMLQSNSRALSNVHFLASARVVRAETSQGVYAEEFIIYEKVRKEIVKLIEMSKGHNLSDERPTCREVIFRKVKVPVTRPGSKSQIIDSNV